ncbi:hypothetical protein PybrP1_010267, partial [[Pythium] brassicae (nom. inval.)]
PQRIDDREQQTLRGEKAASVLGDRDARVLYGSDIAWTNSSSPDSRQHALSQQCLATPLMLPPPPPLSMQSPPSQPQQPSHCRASGTSASSSRSSSDSGNVGARRGSGSDGFVAEDGDGAAGGHGDVRDGARGARQQREDEASEEKRKSRTCVVDGCSNYIVHRHRCFRHGVRAHERAMMVACLVSRICCTSAGRQGGKRCSVDGCNTSAKQRGLCWRHGGSTACKVDGCTRGVKSKGVCWSHGEGLRRQGATTGSVSLPSCIFDMCYRAPAPNGGFCKAHARIVSQPGYVFEL